MSVRLMGFFGPASSHTVHLLLLKLADHGPASPRSTFTALPRPGQALKRKPAAEEATPRRHLRRASARKRAYGGQAAGYAAAHDLFAAGHLQSHLPYCSRATHPAGDDLGRSKEAGECGHQRQPGSQCGGGRSPGQQPDVLSSGCSGCPQPRSHLFHRCLDVWPDARQRARPRTPRRRASLRDLCWPRNKLKNCARHQLVFCSRLVCLVGVSFRLAAINGSILGCRKVWSGFWTMQKLTFDCHCI